MATYTKVKTSGEVLPVPISDFKPVDLLKEMTAETEALVTKNKETLGVFMTVERRNQLSDELATARLAFDMVMAGATPESVRRSFKHADSDELLDGEAALEFLRRRRAQASR